MLMPAKTNLGAPIGADAGPKKVLVCFDDWVKVISFGDVTGWWRTAVPLDRVAPVLYAAIPLDGGHHKSPAEPALGARPSPIAYSSSSNVTRKHPSTSPPLLIDADVQRPRIMPGGWPLRQTRCASVI